MKVPAHKLSGLMGVFSLLAPVLPACAQQTQLLQIKSFSAGPDTTLTYPDNPTVPGHLNGFPDEHTTIIPPASGSADYLVFGAGQIAGGTFGAVVLQTPDLKNFSFATASYSPQVM